MGEAAAKQQMTHDAAISEAVLAVQNAYLERVRAAGAAGDIGAVQALLAELDVKTQELLGTINVSPLTLVEEEPKGAPLYDNSVTSLDLDATVYDGDRDMFLSLTQDPHFSEVSTRLLAEATPHNARRDLLKTALKLTRKLAPQVYEILDQCKANLALKAELELYVVPDVQFNAFCYPPVNGKYIMGVTSALLEKFDRDELAFVIGHEIGHALFAHYRLPVGFLLHHGSDELTPLHAMRLYAWKRSAEITADRVGLLCGRNFEAAAHAFFKLSSGVTDNSLAFQLSEYIAQFTELQDEKGDTPGVDAEDWYSTHPFSPMRVKTLDMFHRSETYHRLIGQSGGAAELSEEQLEFEIKKIMSLMEPSYLQESSELGELMKSFVIFGGYLVAAANGKIEESEIRALGSLLDPKEVEARVAELVGSNADEIENKLLAISEKLNVMLPTVSKLNVIKDLAIIAGADGSIDQTELDVLYEVCQCLAIRPEFVDHVLGDADRET